MSGDEKKPELTPEEQQKADSAEIKAQFGTADMMERMPDFFRGAFGMGPGKSVFGRTDFEGARLNPMLDLLESAKPSDLEEAGSSLLSATKALNEAADDLDKFVRKTEWKGEAATEFQRYGQELAKYAWGLGTFANAVGTQMKVASSGLSSVRSARPPRDGRLVQKKPEDFPAPERTEDNPEYQKALQVEKDRQEAINQMNRLASFYAVSEETLAAQDPPKPPGAVKAPVPQPAGGRDNGVSSADESTRSDLYRTSPSHASPGEGARETDGVSRIGGLDVPGPARESTRMEIDTTSAPPAPTAPPTPGPTSPAPGTAGENRVPSLGPNFGMPVGGGPRSPGNPGVPRSGGGPGPRAVGRPGPAGAPGATPPGRATGLPGRTGMPGLPGTGGATGGPGAAGRPGPMGSPANATGRAPVPGTKGQAPMGGRLGMPGQPAAGRPGAVGGRHQAPAVGRPTTAGRPLAGGGPGAAVGPRAGRPAGIVGGTPQSATGGTPASRLPRGTVIGGRPDTAGRPPTQIPRSGAVGSNPPRGTPPATGRGALRTNGVVGAPRTGATGEQPLARGASSGERSGQRAAGQGGSEDEERQRPTARPERLTEDEWTVRRRGAVPPVIE